MTQLDSQTATPGDVIIELPIDQVVPDPKNRKSGDVAGLAASIKDVGILQPILVVQENGHFNLIAGERRWRAAKKAGLDFVPAIVRSDLAEDIVDEMQLVENLQREGLDPLYEAQSYQRLLAHGGWTQRGLAERIGVSQSHVSKRLQLLELPEVATKALDSGGITVGDALELHKLKDHPKILVEVLKEGQRRGDVEWAVEAAVRGIEEERAKAARTAELQAKGIKIVEAKNSWERPKGVTPIDGYDGLGLDRRKHEKEPCHAVSLLPHQELAWCTDPKRHQAKGESKLKATKRATTAWPGKTDAQKKKDAAEREANAQRKAFITELLARKIRKDDALHLIARRYLDDAAHDEKTAICAFLGLKPGEKTEYGRKVKDVSTPLNEYAAKSTDNLLRACLTFALVQGESALKHSWVDIGGRANDHRRLLRDAGYQPHPSEKAAFAKVK